MHPGTRLRQARKLAGYKSQDEFATALKAAGHHITADRIGRLERGASPKIREMQAISQLLPTSLDWWICGTPSPTSTVVRRINELPASARKAFLAVIDTLRDIARQK